MPGWRLRLSTSRRDIARTISFSYSRPRATAPGSSPPWPGSTTTILAPGCIDSRVCVRRVRSASSRSGRDMSITSRGGFESIAPSEKMVCSDCCSRSRTIRTRSLPLPVARTCFTILSLITSRSRGTFGSTARTSTTILAGSLSVKDSNLASCCRSRTIRVYVGDDQCRISVKRFEPAAHAEPALQHKYGSTNSRQLSKNFETRTRINQTPGPAMGVATAAKVCEDAIRFASHTNTRRAAARPPETDCR